MLAAIRHGGHGAERSARRSARRFRRAAALTGLDLSIVELTDALRAVQHGGLDDRDKLRRLLRITMVKRSEDIAAFDAAFDLFFPAAAAVKAQEAGGEPSGNGIAAQAADPVREG